MREWNFLYCSASALQGDNQFRNNDPFMSFEVSEENWLVRSSLKKIRFNPWDNCKVLDLGRNYQDYKHKLATNCLHSSFADYMLHVIQLHHAMVKKGDAMGQYTGTLHVKLMKRSFCSTPHWKDLQLGYWILFVLDSTTHQKMWRNCRRPIECKKNDQTCLSCTESKHPSTPFSSCRLTSVSFTPANGI